MDIQRAKAIIDSSTLINVSYHGVPVFIQRVNEKDQTAIVFPLNEMNNEQIVPLMGLVEDDIFTSRRLSMDTHRANAIAQSPVMKNVTYNGQQVYIQQVDDQAETARVFPLDEPENEITVPIDGLKEH